MSLDPVIIEFGTLEQVLASPPAFPTPIKFVMAGMPGSYTICANNPGEYKQAVEMAFAFLSLSEEERERRYPPIYCCKY